MKVLRKGPPSKPNYFIVECHDCSSLLMFGDDEMSSTDRNTIGSPYYSFECSECGHKHVDISMVNAKRTFFKIAANSALLYVLLTSQVIN